MAGMFASPYRICGLAVALSAAIALVIAIGSERWGGLVPCALCLWERWPYRIAALLGLAAWFLPPRQARWVIVLLGLTMLADVALGIIHAGVEAHWWKSPLPECAAPVFSGGSVADRLAHMPAAPSKPCDEPSYLIHGLPLSFAGMNLLLASVLTAACAWTAIRRPEP